MSEILRWQNFFQAIESLMNAVSKLILLKTANSWAQEKVIISLKTSCAPTHVILNTAGY